MWFIVAFAGKIRTTKNSKYEQKNNHLKIDKNGALFPTFFSLFRPFAFANLLTEKFLPMIGFELRFFHVGSNSSTNTGATAARSFAFLKEAARATLNVFSQVQDYEDTLIGRCRLSRAAFERERSHKGDSSQRFKKS